MADDLTIEVPPPQLRECPTCGKNYLPGENECSVCGTQLQPDALDSTVSMPPPLSPPQAIPTAPTSPRESPVQLSPSARPQASPSVPFVAPLSLPSLPTKTSPFPWLKLLGGACMFMLLGGVVDRIVFQGRGAPVASLSTEMSSEVRKESREAPSPSLPLVGQVVVATDLLPIQVFGIQGNEKTAAIAAFGEQMEKALPSLRHAYNSRLAENAHTSGALVLELAVNATGQVVDVRTYTTGIDSDDLQQTVQRVAKEWRFSVSQEKGWKLFCPLLLIPPHADLLSLVSYAKEAWPGQYKVLTATPVLVYQTTNESAPQVGSIRSGLRVYVISSQRDWLGVLSPQGEVGYVRRETLFPRVEYSSAAESRY